MSNGTGVVETNNTAARAEIEHLMNEVFGHGEKPSQQALNRAAVTVEQAEALLSALRINHTARRKNPNQKNNVGRQSLLVKACLSQ